MAVATVDEYIGSFPADVREILEEIRRRIRRAVPGAGETIRYSMPTVTLDGGYLVHFAAWKHHIALYPMPPLDGPLEAEISRYRAAKDTVRFPLREPVPFDLIERVVGRLAEMRAAGPG